MRQLTILVVGLMLIFCWATLIRTLRNQSVRNEHSQVPEVVREPQRIASLPARELRDAVTSSNSGEFAFHYDHDSQSDINQVVTAGAFEIDSTTAIIDAADAKDPWVWKKPIWNSGIWLRSNKIKTQMTVGNGTYKTTVAIPGAPVVVVDSVTVTSGSIEVAVDNLPAGESWVDLKLNQSPKEFAVSVSRSQIPDSFHVHVPNPSNAPAKSTVNRSRLGLTYPWTPHASSINLFRNVTTTVGFEAIPANTRDRFHVLAVEKQGGKFEVISSHEPPMTELSNGQDLARRFDVPLVQESEGRLRENMYVAIISIRQLSTGSANHIVGDPTTFAFPTAPPPSSGLSISEVYGAAVTPATALRTTQRSQDKSLKLTHSVTSAKTAINLFNSESPIGDPIETSVSPITVPRIELNEGENRLFAQMFAGDEKVGTTSAIVPVEVRTDGFEVTRVEPLDLGVRLGATQLLITFSRALKVDDTIISRWKANNGVNAPFRISYSANARFDGDLTTEQLPNIEAEDGGKAIRLTVAGPKPGGYQLRITGEALTDYYGNKLTAGGGIPGGIYVKELGGADGRQRADFTVTPGVNRSDAPLVEFPEFVEPRNSSKGFNPSDKVETRVARLYFYRDAHRVAQILNRKVQSYNRQDVTLRHQQADKARQEAESLTTNRQIAEREAVTAAQRTRELENQLSDTQRSLNSTLQQIQLAAAQQVDPGTTAAQQKTDTLNKLQSAAQSFANQASQLETQIRSARETEVASNERWQQAQRKEELARADQFRLETAAAHADPDTFVPGNPRSIDPVAQASISVIGEGLLHLRGPLKGVNQLRLMVDQIDSPQGQVRINVHSTQINGDEADKLEVVANRIQTYIDQARFLTVQSGEMLRKAVVHVAAARAEDARGLYPGASQAERDQLYLHAFFGRDFVAELQTIDSEFLHTGNKLLSLHSMDVTSLSSALTMLALANNGTRLAILQEFQRLLQSDLSIAEQEYLRNGIGCCKGGCKLGCKHSHHAPRICSLTQNATFTSLRGFFDSQISHDDTLTPLQREMIRLAQILKARLVTELEYKQRVMERAVIEQRMDSSSASHLEAEREIEAEKKSREARELTLTSESQVIAGVGVALAEVNSILQALENSHARSHSILARTLQFVGAIDRNSAPSARDTVGTLQQVRRFLQDTESFRIREFNSEQHKANSGPVYVIKDGLDTSYLKNYALLIPTAEKSSTKHPDTSIYLGLTPADAASVRSLLNQLSDELMKIQSVLEPMGVLSQSSRDGVTRLASEIKTETNRAQDIEGGGFVAIATIDKIMRSCDTSGALLERAVATKNELDVARSNAQQFEAMFRKYRSRKDVDLSSDGVIDLYKAWTTLASSITALYQNDPSKQAENKRNLNILAVNRQFEMWLEAISRAEVATLRLHDARRPLDHKKFLDMLIDDLEEKYIELLEGTRAHTANIDNYLKRLTTSLDDDFNTQFYYPVFRLVREASQFKRVEFGQTETTNVLANNREFAKVSPSATMEFDLPKRDILIEEGLDAALAIYNDVGALVNDPNLLALAKLKSGSSAASPPAGSLGGFGSVRNVLPTLQGSTSEQLLARSAGSGPEFESNVEKLIPDPAIYKFETGTGYEIRPVIAPDGQAVVFDFHYLYTTQVREPVRADEKHLGRVKQHFIDTDVQLSNFELREVSRYVVALKAERTAKGVPLLEDIPLVGALWRPLPSDEKSLQQNIIMAQATIFPTLFDLMGLRWAPAVSDLDPLRLSNREYLVRGRHKYLENRIYDYSSARVDEFLRIPEDLRRADLYRSQESIPSVHPNGYRGPGLDLQNSQMREGYDPESTYVSPTFVPAQSAEGATYLPHRQGNYFEQLPPGATATPDRESLQLAPQGQRIGQPSAIPSQSPVGAATNSPSDGWQYAR